MPTAQEQIDKLEPLYRSGVQIVEETPNLLRARMPLAGNANHFGAMYAGSIFTLAEFPFGALFMQSIPQTELVPVIGELTIRYLAPVLSDLYVTVEINDEELERIRTDASASGKAKLIRSLELKDESGNVKAVASATYFALPGA